MEESHRASVYTIDGTLTPISPFFPLRQMKEYISLLMFPYFHFSFFQNLHFPLTLLLRYPTTMFIHVQLGFYLSTTRVCSLQQSFFSNVPIIFKRVISFTALLELIDMWAEITFHTIFMQFLYFSCGQKYSPGVSPFFLP